MRTSTPGLAGGPTARGPGARDDLIDCEVCGDAHPGASDCPWELFAAGLGSDPRNVDATENPGSADVEYRRSVLPSQKQRPPPSPTESDCDDQSVGDDVTRLVERLDTIVRYGIPAIPEIIASAEDLIGRTSPDDTDSAAEELRCIAEDLLGLATTLPDIAGRLCLLADAMEKT